MGTKQILLRMLEENRGEALSGEQLAFALGVSRAAVWKAAEALRREGLDIESLPGSGYRLRAGSDYLTPEGILAAYGKEIPLRVLQEVDSTNLEAKRWAMDAAPHGALVVADRQTGGRGRRGRGFVSPPGGAYMSVVLRPNLPAETAVLVTTAAAVATCEAVEALCGLQLDIKWVNDLFYKGRKCCGILSEAATDFETGTLEYVVVGIGVNLTTPQNAFGEFADVATALYPAGGALVTRAALVAEIHKRLLALYKELPNRAFLQGYRERCFVLGKEVTVLAQTPYTACAVGIDDDARLVVRCADGTQKALASGEISITLER